MEQGAHGPARCSEACGSTEERVGSEQAAHRRRANEERCQTSQCPRVVLLRAHRKLQVVGHASSPSASAAELVKQTPNVLREKGCRFRQCRM